MEKGDDRYDDDVDEVLVPETPTPNPSTHGRSHSPGLMSGQEPLVVMSFSNSHSHSHSHSRSNLHTPAHAQRSASRRQSSRRLSFGIGLWSPAPVQTPGAAPTGALTPRSDLELGSGKQQRQQGNGQRLNTLQAASPNDHSSSLEGVKNNSLRSPVKTSTEGILQRSKRRSVSATGRHDDDDDNYEIAPNVPMSAFRESNVQQRIVQQGYDNDIRIDNGECEEEKSQQQTPRTPAQKALTPSRSLTPAAVRSHADASEKVGRGRHAVLTPPRKRLSRKAVEKPAEAQPCLNENRQAPQLLPQLATEVQPQPQSSIYSYALNDDDVAQDEDNMNLNDALKMVSPASVDSLRDLRVQRKYGKVAAIESNSKTSRPEVHSGDNGVKFERRPPAGFRTRFTHTSDDGQTPPSHGATENNVTSITSPPLRRTIMKVRSLQSKKPISTPPATSTLAYLVKHPPYLDDNDDKEEVEEQKVEEQKPKPVAKTLSYLPLRPVNMKPNIRIHNNNSSTKSKKQISFRHHRISTAPMLPDADTRDEIDLSGYDSSSTDSASPSGTGKRRLNGHFGKDEIGSRSPGEPEALICRPVSVSIPAGGLLSPNSDESDDDDLSNTVTDHGTMNTSFAQRLCAKTR